jgi:hypothetical protein
MARKKLTKAQKARNKAENNRIKRAYATTDRSISYKAFKRRVVNRAKGEEISIKEAAKKEARTRTFKSADDIGKENIINAMKKDFKADYKEFRKAMGRMNKGETYASRLEWDTSLKSWTFKNNKGDKYMINEDNSPKQMEIIKL